MSYRTRQDKHVSCKAIQDSIRQYKTRQANIINIRQDKTKQDKATQYNNMQGRTIQDNTIQDNTIEDKTTKTRQPTQDNIDKTRQDKTK